MINPTEMVATLINQGESFEAGLAHAMDVIRGSCSILLLTEKGIDAARDRLGRTPVIIGRKETGWAVTMETCALPNLGYGNEHYLGPGVFRDAHVHGPVQGRWIVERTDVEQESVGALAALGIFHRDGDGDQAKGIGGRP